MGAAGARSAGAVAAEEEVMGVRLAEVVAAEVVAAVEPVAAVESGAAAEMVQSMV